jgi:hypothetical protein
VVILRGGMGRKPRQAVRDEMAALPEGNPRVIVATGSCIGEGFDDPKLDTLFLAWPISQKGMLQQTSAVCTGCMRTRRSFGSTSTVGSRRCRECLRNE